MERIKSSGDEQHKCSMKKRLRRALQDSQREIQELAAESAWLKELEAKNARLEELEAENAWLKAKNARLEELEAENAWLKELEVLNGRLEAENALLKAENARVKDLEAETQRLEKLRAENAALKKQITMENISWGEERKKMVEKLKSSTSLLLKSKDDLTSLIQLVESEKAQKKELEKELRNMNMSFKVKEVEVVFLFKVKEEEVVSLNADLKLQQDKLQQYILKNEGRSEEIEELNWRLR
ncbi:coiled-coil domain-containing protein 30-like [Hippoglossus stenolepis]|uniref:coiled-coil domain-containing protein 30-like n=1 Tax=Hippoglossus stenolepis TaxID=195615 RepID=UPI001FAEDBC4|nr:coiled-coil domain-containing protein 30-like [Hippoglossus stenolepis]